jgi:hypothetical protein
MAFAIVTGNTFAAGDTVTPAKLNNIANAATVTGELPVNRGGTNASTAAGARTSLDVPSNAEALLAANNLSDVANANTAKLNLGIDEARYVTTAQFDKTNTTLANITGLSATLVDTTTYGFEAMIYVTQDTTGKSKVAMSGTASVSDLRAHVMSTEQTILAVTNLGAITALDSSKATTSTSASTFYLIKGVLTASSNGTLTVQFAQNSATGTSSALVGSYLRVWSF